MFIGPAAAGVGRPNNEISIIHPKNEITKNLTHYHIFLIHYNLYNIVIFFYSVLVSIVVIVSIVIIILLLSYYRVKSYYSNFSNIR